MLIGYAHVSKPDGSQSLDLQREALIAAGVKLVSEEGKSGVGVRFREQKFEYVSSLKVDRFKRSATMRMRYAGEDFQCVINLDAIGDYHQDNFSRYRGRTGNQCHFTCSDCRSRT